MDKQSEFARNKLSAATSTITSSPIGSPEVMQLRLIPPKETTLDHSSRVKVTPKDTAIVSPEEDFVVNPDST